MSWLESRLAALPFAKRSGGSRMTNDLAKRAERILGPERSAQVIKLADALMRDDDAATANALGGMRHETPPQTKPFPAAHRVTLAVSASDARMAGGTDSHPFNAKIIRETLAALCSPNDDEVETKAQEVIAALRHIGPLNAREALLARRMVALDGMCMDNLRLARNLPESSPLRAMLTGQALALDSAALALDEALSRRRAGCVQKIIVERIE
jgi:hypothetical protein